MKIAEVLNEQENKEESSYVSQMKNEIINYLTALKATGVESPVNTKKVVDFLRNNLNYDINVEQFVDIMKDSAFDVTTTEITLDDDKQSKKTSNRKSPDKSIGQKALQQAKQNMGESKIQERSMGSKRDKFVRNVSQYVNKLNQYGHSAQVRGCYVDEEASNLMANKDLVAILSVDGRDRYFYKMDESNEFILD